MVELPGEDTVKNVLHETNKQGGPIAVLAIMLVAAMLAGVGVLGYVLVPVMRDYISASTATLNDNSKSFADLSASMQTVHHAHASMMQATEVMQEAVAGNAEKLKMLQASIDQMATIMAEARVMMQNVPQQRAEQTRLLQQIDSGIQQLADELRKQSGGG